MVTVGLHWAMTGTTMCDKTTLIVFVSHGNGELCEIVDVKFNGLTAMTVPCMKSVVSEQDVQMVALTCGTTPAEAAAGLSS